MGTDDQVGTAAKCGGNQTVRNAQPSARGPKVQVGGVADTGQRDDDMCD